MNRRTALQLIPAMGCAPYAAAQDDSSTSVMQRLTAEADRILERAERELASKESWEPLRARRRRELQDMLGLDPWPARTPLNVQFGKTVDRDDHVVMPLAFESLPKFYVTADYYLPKQRTGKIPVIVYVCGHSIVPQGAKTSYQRHGISFARNGYACLILDPIQISEVFALHHGVRGLQLWDWYARGYAPAGIEVWNAIRALDYLATRPECDMNLVGMTGRSGGAAMTWFTAALDDRVKAAAPVMGISTYAANLRANTQRLHCDCMFPINFHRHEMSHQGALIAPRPLLMAHGRKDDLFPVPGYTKVEEHMTRLYQSYGHPERFRNLVVDTGHQDSDYLREQVIRWFDRHLLNQDRQPEMTVRNTDADQLRVFAGRPPLDAVNPKIHILYRGAAKPVPPRTRAEWEKRKEDLLATLRRRVFAELASTPAPVMRMREPSAEGKHPTLLYVMSSGDDTDSIQALFRLGGLPDATVRALLQPHDWQDRPMKPVQYRDLLRNAMHAGTTPETLRVGDVLGAFERLRTNPKVDSTRILVAGRGADAGVALYAAVLEPRIRGVLLLDPPESHVHGPIFLNVLRYTDLPEAAGLIAPRRLHFFHRTPGAYDLTRRIYEVLGARIQEIYSLEDAFK